MFQRGPFVSPFPRSIHRDTARSCHWLPLLSAKHGGVEIALRDPQASRCKYGSRAKGGPWAHRPTGAVHLSPLRNKNSVGGFTLAISRPGLFFGLDQGQPPYPTQHYAHHLLDAYYIRPRNPQGIVPRTFIEVHGQRNHVSCEMSNTVGGGYRTAVIRNKKEEKRAWTLSLEMGQKPKKTRIRIL